MNGDGLTTPAYKNRISHLSVILVQLLEDAGLHDALRAMEHTQRLKDGVRFLATIRDYLMPSTNSDILKCIEDLATCVLANGESLDSYYARLEHIWIWIEHQKCLSIKELRLAFLQRGILNSVYQNTECINYFKQKITYGEGKVSTSKCEGEEGDRVSESKSERERERERM